MDRLKFVDSFISRIQMMKKNKPDGYVVVLAYPEYMSWNKT